MLIVNATQVKKGYSGVGVYSIDVIKHLVKKIDNGIIYSSLNEFGNLPEKWHLKLTMDFNRDLIRWLWINIIFLFKLKKNDVLYCTFSEAPVFFRGKLIITVHDLMPINFPENHSKKLRFYYRKILYRNLKNAFKIIVISETVKKDIIKFYPDIEESKIKLIYNGYDSSIFNTFRPENEINNFKLRYGLNNYIIYVGRISRIKNVLCLLKAFIHIKDKITHNLVIIGKDESQIMPEALEMLKSGNIDSRVVFIKHLNKNELQFALKGADLFLSASLSEGFGMPAIEAMACGVPCILSDIDAFREISGGAAAMFNPSEPAELADKILQLLNNENLYNMHKAKGLEAVKNFSWEKTVSGIGTIITHALNEN